MSDDLLYKSEITDAWHLANCVLRFAHLANDDGICGYRVDVFMDRKNHAGRTMLDSESFMSVDDMIKYALDNTSAKQCQIIRKSGKRLSGDVYVNYVLYLS